MTTSIPTVEQIETFVFRLPLRGALRWGKASTLAEVRHVLVRVTLSDGSCGQAEAPPRPTIYGETEQSITGIIEHELAPRVLGMAITISQTLETEPAHQWLQPIAQKLHEIKGNNTAIGALDMALHDALAAHRGMSLLEHLDACQTRLRVSYILGIADPDDMVAEAERVANQGVRVLKVKVGRDWAQDLAAIARLQEALGPSVQLYADANECLTAENAARRLDRLRELGLLFCEEPLPVEQIRARADLRARDVLPLIADDSTFTQRDLARELSFDTFDILNIKTARTGYTESDAMLAAATRAGKGVMVGSQASAGLGTARAALFAARPGIDHPSELSFFLKLKEDIVAQPLTLTDGYLNAADAARTEIDAALLAAATVQRNSITRR